MSLWREYKILWLKMRRWWWQWDLESIDPLHEDLPMVLRKVWDLHTEIKALEAQR